MGQRTVMLGSTDTAGKVSPLREFLLFPFGVTETEYGAFTLTEQDAAAVMASYAVQTAQRDGWLDIDYQHRSRRPSGTVEDLLSAGKFRLALRDDGLWAVDVTYTDRARALVEAGELWSSSVVFGHDKDGHVRSISQLALTNIPAGYQAGMIAAAVSGFKNAPLMDGAWDAAAADGRVRAYLSANGSGDLDQVDMARYRGCYVFYDEAAPDNISAFKGLICDVENDALRIHKGAVQALAGAMQGARGGLDVDVSPEDITKGRALLARYYALWDGVPPWETEMADESKTMSRPLAAPSVVALAETMGYADRMEAVRDAAAAALRLSDDGPWCCLEYIDDTTAIIEVYGAPGPGPSNRYYRTTYEILADGTAKLGALEEVVHGDWIPKTQETAMSQTESKTTDTATVELAQRVERLTEVQTRLLSLTGETTPAQALIRVEAAMRDAAAKPALEKRLGDLEVREYTREREVLLSAARRDGKYTVDMEANADAAADMAGRLGEDRVTALSAFWKRAPVVVAPGGHSEPATPDATTTVALSQADREAIELAATQYPNLKREDLEREYLANKNRMLKPRF